MRNKASSLLRFVTASPLRAAAVCLIALIPVFYVVNAENATPKFPLSDKQAIAAAKGDPRVKKVLKATPADRIRVSPIDHREERVTFFNGYVLIVDAALERNGSVDRVAPRAIGLPESGSSTSGAPLALAVLTALFLLSLAVVPIVSLRNLDLLFATAMMLPILLLDYGLAEPSLWIVYPVFAYLAVRCALVGLGIGSVGAQQRSLYWHLTQRWSAHRRVRMLKILAGALVLAFVMLIPSSTGASDVTYASVGGATEMLRGVSPYGHLGSFVLHGDTYPPLNYVLYIPGALISPLDDFFDDPIGGLIVTLVAALIAAAALYRVGRDMVDRANAVSPPAPDAEPAQAVGLRLAIAWMTFPPVLFAATGGSNDMLVSAALALALAYFHRERVSTLLLGLAAWIKIIPVLAIPVWLARMDRRRALQATMWLAALSFVTLAGLVALDGFGTIPAMAKAIMFQMDRSSLRSLWVGLGLAPLQPIAQAGLIATVVMASVAMRRDHSLRSDLVRAAALVATIEIVAQVAANYTTVAYTPWVLVPLLASLLAPVARPVEASQPVSVESPERLPAPRPAEPSYA